MVNLSGIWNIQCPPNNIKHKETEKNLSLEKADQYAKQLCVFPKERGASSLKRFHTWGSEENATQAKKTDWGEERIHFLPPSPCSVIQHSEHKSDFNQLPQWEKSPKSAPNWKHPYKNITSPKENKNARYVSENPRISYLT